MLDGNIVTVSILGVRTDYGITSLKHQNVGVSFNFLESHSRMIRVKKIFVLLISLIAASLVPVVAYAQDDRLEKTPFSPRA